MSAKNSKKIFFIVLAAVVVIGVVALCYVFRSPSHSVAKEKAAFTLTSDELYAAFEENEATANEKYLGKVIEVTGTVGEVEKAENGQLTVVLTCSNPMGGVRCSFNEKQDEVSGQLTEGSSHTIKGKCSGVLMEVVLDDCSLQK
ncbi:MAG TPA: hypothetical protein PKH79_03620 [Prolixibacteraceae bacterium]|nr:hypothetical protein [Prolixibacteraceae bacterium]HPS11767.1 hypothetical protein [Prolixibacteraceae bacterium]